MFGNVVMGITVNPNRRVFFGHILNSNTCSDCAMTFESRDSNNNCAIQNILNRCDANVHSGRTAEFLLG
jgi:hypothetical protein